MEMSQLIHNYVQDNGILKNVIARKCGIEEKRFYRMLNGQSKMTVDEYETICRDGLGVDPAYFFKQKLSKNESKKSA